MGQGEQSSQLATGIGLAEARTNGSIAGQGIGEKLLVAGQLGFGLKHLKLGGYAGLETGTSITQADQRSPDGFLANAHLFVGRLEIEVGLGCL